MAVTDVLAQTARTSPCEDGCNSYAGLSVTAGVAQTAAFGLIGGES